jgi:hypothetical protein
LNKNVIFINCSKRQFKSVRPSSYPVLSKCAFQFHEKNRWYSHSRFSNGWL